MKKLLCISLLMTALLLASCSYCPSHRVHFATQPCDVPMLDYPQYREMMANGSVEVELFGEWVVVNKGDFTFEELQKMGLTLRPA